jgi:hypothetical protein
MRHVLLDAPAAMVAGDVGVKLAPESLDSVVLGLGVDGRYQTALVVPNKRLLP